MNNWIKAFRRTPYEVAVDELESAERDWLEATTNREYWSSMEAFNKARVQRLRKTVEAARG